MLQDQGKKSILLLQETNHLNSTESRENNDYTKQETEEWDKELAVKQVVLFLKTDLRCINVTLLPKRYTAIWAIQLEMQ